jgi:hypothetical protein
MNTRMIKVKFKVVFDTNVYQTKGNEVRYI